MIRIQNLGCIQIHKKQIQSTDRYAGRNTGTHIVTDLFSEVQLIFHTPLPNIIL